MDILEFEDWYALNEQDLICEVAETGLDRELDFDRESWKDQKYDEYTVKELNNRNVIIEASYSDFLLHTEDISQKGLIKIIEILSDSAPKLLKQRVIKYMNSNGWDF